MAIREKKFKHRTFSKSSAGFMSYSEVKGYGHSKQTYLHNWERMKGGTNGRYRYKASAENMRSELMSEIKKLMRLIYKAMNPHIESYLERALARENRFINSYAQNFGIPNDRQSVKKHLTTMISKDEVYFDVLDIKKKFLTSKNNQKVPAGAKSYKKLEKRLYRENEVTKALPLTEIQKNMVAATKSLIESEFDKGKLMQALSKMGKAGEPLIADVLKRSGLSAEAIGEKISQSQDIRITLDESEYTIEMKTNISRQFQKTIEISNNSVSLRKISEKTGINMSDFGGVLYILANQIKNPQWYTNAGYYLQNIFLYFDIFKALEGTEFNLITKKNKQVKDSRGVLALVGKEFIYFSELIRSLQKVLKSSNPRAATLGQRNQSFFYTATGGVVGKGGNLASKKREAVTKHFGKGADYNNIYSLLRNEQLFNQVYKNVQDTRFKLSYSIALGRLR